MDEDYLLSFVLDVIRNRLTVEHRQESEWDSGRISLLLDGEVFTYVDIYQ